MTFASTVPYRVLPSRYAGIGSLVKDKQYFLDFLAVLDHLGNFHDFESIPGVKSILQSRYGNKVGQIRSGVPSGGFRG